MTGQENLGARNIPLDPLMTWRGSALADEGGYQEHTPGPVCRAVFGGKLLPLPSPPLWCGASSGKSSIRH